jgi:hypothetical protein
MGGKTSESTSTVSIPPEILARYNAVNAKAEEAAQIPFQQYGGQFVAGLTPTQQAGIQNTSAAAGQAQPYYSAATGLALAGTTQISPGELQTSKYMNPYTQAVAAPTYEALRQQQGQERAQQQAQAIKSGAFGGDRAGLERANLSRQQNLATAQAIAPIFQQGYQQALGTAQQQQGVGLAAEQANRAAFQQGAQQMAGLGTGAQSAALQGAQAQIQAGAQEQQTNQADLTARYQQFLQERGYPFQTAQFLANIAMGTGALSGSTTTSTQPAGFFSDERLKEDIKRVGETDDGLPIYSYRYKGDKKTQIGLIAQDVEKEKPEAVGLAPAADGKLYKTVDYKKATEDRPHREYGGGLDVNSMGGAVFERGNYATSGFVGPFNPDEDQKRNSLGGSGPYGVSLSTLTPGKLMVAQPPAAQPSGFSQAVKTGTDFANLAKMGKAGLVGTAPTSEDKEGTAGILGGQGKMSGKNIFSELDDWLKKKPNAAHGGLIVGRHHYEDGGDVNDDENDDANEDRAHVPSSALPADVLASAPKPGQLATAQTQKGRSEMEDIADIAKTAASIFAMSDERMKHNKERIGYLYDGQPVYSYDFGDGETQIGLIAQKVERDHPEAVMENKRGLKLVDYEAATQDAAAREHHADGKRVGGGSREDSDLRLDDERLAEILASGQKAPNIVPVEMNFDPGLNLRGRYMQADKYSNVAAGLGFPVGRARAELDGSYGWVRGAPQAPTNKSIMGRFTVPFAEGGLVPRQHHAVGERAVAEVPDVVFSEEADLPAVNAREAMAVDPGLKAPPKYKIEPQNKEDMEPYKQVLIDYIYPREGGLDKEGKPRYNVRQGTGKETFDIEAGHPGLKPAPGGKSSASGAGQFIHETWNRVTGGAPMTKEYQDAATWKLASDDYAKRTGRDLGADLKEKGLTPEIKAALKPTWEGIDAPRGVSTGSVASKKDESGGLNIKGISDTVTSDKFLVPFLSFVGSTLASQRPTLGGALGEGIVGGVAGYQENKKVQAALAKGVLDILKDRFNVTSDPKTGQTIYFNKATGQTISAAQYTKAAGDIAESMGVPRGVLGISTEGTEVPSVSKTTQPGEFSRPGAGVTRTADTTKSGTTETGGEKKEAPAEVVDTRKMNPTELFDYAVANKAKYKLLGPKDPDALEAEAAQFSRMAESERLAGNSAGATSAIQQAKDIRDRRDQYVKDAISFEIKNNQDIQQAKNEDSAESYKAARARVADYPKDRALIMRTADILADYRAGRLSPVRAYIGDVANTLGIPLPKGFFNAEATDELVKSALTQVVAQVSARDLGRAPGTAIKTLQQTVANPEMSPGSAFAIMGRTLGDLEREYDSDVAYIKKGRGVDYGEHIIDYNTKQDPSEYYRRAYGTIPEPVGMEAAQRESLQKTYKYKPKTRMTVEDEARPAAPAVAPGTKPGERKQFKQGWGVWNGTQWVPENAGG